MKNWVFLVGMISLSVAIIIAGVLLSRAIEQTGSNLGNTLVYMIEMWRGTLLSITK